MKDNIIQEKAFNFALKIIELYKRMNSKKEFILSKQLLRSGTSIGANVEEASAAISRRDFVNKMSISSKEAREARYWLKLIERSKIVDVNVQDYLIEIDEIINILTAIIKTTQKNLN